MCPARDPPPPPGTVRIQLGARANEGGGARGRLRAHVCAASGRVGAAGGAAINERAGRGGRLRRRRRRQAAPAERGAARGASRAAAAGTTPCGVARAAGDGSPVAGGA